jgi:hypothetical protein
MPRIAIVLGQDFTGMIWSKDTFFVSSFAGKFVQQWLSSSSLNSLICLGTMPLMSISPLCPLSFSQPHSQNRTTLHRSTLQILHLAEPTLPSPSYPISPLFKDLEAQAPQTCVSQPTNSTPAATSPTNSLSLSLTAWLR